MIEKDLKSLRIDPLKKQTAWGPSRTALVVVVLVGIVILAALAYSYILNSTPASATEDNAETTSAATPPVSAYTSDILIVPGYVVAHHKIQVGSKVMGKVAWIGVEKGDSVKKGRLLVKLDDREYRARVEEAAAASQSWRARLRELETGSRPEEIARAHAEVERALAEQKNAASESERAEKLLKRGVVAQKAVDDARARLEIAEAAVKVAQKNYDLAKLGPRSEQIALARAEVDRAEANLEHAKTLLEATEIRAPISGTVLQRLVEVGEMVTTSFAGEMGAKSAVVALADLSDLQVELDISQTDFNRISREQQCVMSPEAFPDREYPCAIAEIAPEANRQKSTIQVKVKILNPDQFLRPEMNARVTFRKGKRS